MEYVDILSIVMDSDTKTTREYTSLFEGVPTQYFEDSNRLSDTEIMHKTDDGRFVSLRKDDDIIYLDYYFAGKGSFKSCTKKVELQFSTHIKDELEYLDSNTLTNSADDLDQYIWCMEATVFDLIRDSVDFNQITKKEKYSVSYHLRKNQDEHFFLESKIWLVKPNKLSEEYQTTEISTFNDIKPTWQRIIRGNNNLSYKEQLAEIDEFDELFGDDIKNDLDDEYDDYNELEDIDDEFCL